MNDYDPLRSAIDANNDDWDLKLILADLCEEQGRDSEARFWRWMNEHKRRAWHNSSEWFSWCTNYSTPERMSLHCNSELNTPLFKLLEGEDNKDSQYGAKRFNSNKDADNALFNAWKKLNNYE